MSDDAAQRLRQRLQLILRAERAMGGSGFPTPVMGAAVVSDVPVVVNERSDRVERPIADAQPSRASPAKPKLTAATAGSAASAAPVLIEAAPVGVEFGPQRPPFESPILPTEKKVALLQAMNDAEVKGCTKCILCQTRTNTVFDEGDADARLMFIGEGPGENEDLQGRPFIGKAGELLNKMIGGMGLRREQVYIANIVKCRPPNNRVPAPDEVATCTPYLERQIETIRPQVIVTLGLPSTQYMLQSKLAMGKLRGQWHAWRGIKLMPTYHPAYVLRSYTEQTRAAVWSDLQQVMSALGLELKRKPRADA